jgi:glucokinase
VIEVVAVDIGGTHARFALAVVDAGRVVAIGAEVVLKTAEHASLQTAWQAFAASAGRRLPRAASIAVACPIQSEVLQLTNNPWVIRPPSLAAELGLDRATLLNDFAAVAHAVVQSPSEHLRHICGPDIALPDQGMISIVGPGTGLGVAALLRTSDGYEVLPTEGGHADFAPLDSVDDAILARLRQRHRRVSVERIVAGPGLVDIHAVLTGIEGRPPEPTDVKVLWAAALAGDDSLAAAALDRFCLNLGAVAGDIALTQGAAAVVIAGGIGLRLAEHLPQSGFGQRFTAKGRFEAMMSGLPVKLITHPQPGLLGAAAAFAKEHRA